MQSGSRQKFVGQLLLGLFALALSVSVASAKPTKDAVSEFQQAAKAGDVVAVESMVAEGLSPNQLSDEDRPILVDAVKRGDFRMARLLLKLGANANYRGKTNESPLFATFVNRYILRIPGEWEAIEKELREAGAKDDLGSAAVSGNLKAIQKLLDGGEKVNTAIDGDSLIVLASVAKHEKVVKELLKRGAKVGLLEATALRDYKKVDTLIKDGADIFVAGSDGMTAMHVAAWQNDAKLIHRLKKAGLSADQEVPKSKKKRKTSGLTPLLSAGIYEKMDAVNALLDIGADVNSTKGVGMPPLVFALILGRLEFMKALISHGAKVNLTSEPNGLKPIHFAALLGNVKAAKLLLENGADPEPLTSDGLRPLHLSIFALGLPAQATGNLMRSLGASFIPMKDKPDALGLEVPLKHEEMLKLLLKHGADLERENDMGLSPLGFAQKTGNLDLMDLIMELTERKKLKNP